ncbi:DUF5994 family protein [Streptomyces sp. NPDC053427]|uniref:DUF5994 family protein n=1 Tax=Streptomyces sp. NPDC053427 TaxID=3365701 RepID=UPI0037D1C5DB
MTTAPLGPIHDHPTSHRPHEHPAPTPHEHLEPPAVSRLTIAPPGPVLRRIDGTWWPHSTDLLTELPELLRALPFDWPRITHATVNGAIWSALPTRILVEGHVVRLRRIKVRQGPDADTVCLVAAGHGRWDLRIIPPDTPEAEAVQIMARVAEEATEPEPG